MPNIQIQQVPSAFPDQNILFNSAAGITGQQIQRNELLNTRAQQEIGGAEIEYAARAAQGLLGLGDEAAMAAAYPGAVASAQQHGFLKNAPSVFPGKARLEQIAAMAIPAEKQYEQQGVAGDYQTWLRSRGGGTATGTVTPGVVPAVAPGGGFTGDREKDRALIVKQESGGDPTVLNYVARQDPTAYARGATASGKYQFVNSTWREGLQLAGLDPAQYPEARQAPEAVQDKVFDAVYGKYGTKPWEKGAKDWVRDEHGNYQIATVRPPAGASGGAPAAPGTPPPYQLAGQPVGPPGTPPAAGMPVPGGQGLVTRPDGTVGTPNAGGLGTEAPPAAVAAPAQPPPAATPPAPVANIPPPPPRMANGLDAEQNRTIQQLEAIRPRNRAEFDQQQKLIATTEQTYRDHNDTVQRQYQTDVRLAQKDAEAAASAQQTAADRAEAAKRDAKRLELQINEAKRAGLPTGYKLDDNGKAVRIDGLPPDPAVQEAQDKIAARATAEAKQQFEQADKLRDEFQKLTGDFRIVQTSYENIRSAAKANDGAGDMSMLYNYVRLLDPTSVVRESEFASAAASGSFGERVQGAVARVLSGARMPESLRQSFIREGRNLYDNQLKAHDAVANQYETLAKRFGLEPDRVVTRFNRPQDDKASDAAVGPVSVKTPEEAQGLKPGTRYKTPDGQEYVR